MLTPCCRSAGRSFICSLRAPAADLCHRLLDGRGEEKVSRFAFPPSICRIDVRGENVSENGGDAHLRIATVAQRVAELENRIERRLTRALAAADEEVAAPMASERMVSRHTG